MKKLFAMLLVLAMIFSFAACGGGSTVTDDDFDDVKGEQIANDETEEDTEEETEEATEEVTEEASEEKQFELGKATGLEYNNKFLGVACKLDSGWTFSTDEEIAELNQYTQDTLGDDYTEFMESAATYTDMQAYAANGLDNVSVIFEKSTVAQVLAADLEANFTATIPTLKSMLADMGYTNIVINVEDITIDGKTYTGIVSSAEINGVKMYQASAGMKCGGYIASITVTTYGENTVQDIFDCFYHI